MTFTHLPPSAGGRRKRRAVGQKLTWNMCPRSFFALFRCAGRRIRPKLIKFWPRLVYMMRAGPKSGRFGASLGNLSVMFGRLWRPAPGTYSGGWPGGRVPWRALIRLRTPPEHFSVVFVHHPQVRRASVCPPATLPQREVREWGQQQVRHVGQQPFPSQGRGHFRGAGRIWVEFGRDRAETGRFPPILGPTLANLARHREHLGRSGSEVNQLRPKSAEIEQLRPSRFGTEQNSPAIDRTWLGIGHMWPNVDGHDISRFDQIWTERTLPIRHSLPELDPSWPELGQR